MALLGTRATLVLSFVFLAVLSGAGAANADTSTGCTPGLHTLRLGSGRTALMRVTPGDARERRALLLVLHGGGESPSDGLAAFHGGFTAHGLVLVAPSSRGSGWSFERGSGDDLAAVGRALTQTYARCAIDSSRVGIGGFSDGATSALSLGMTNGRLFRAIVALSPGHVPKQTPVGRPRVFVAHGTSDSVYPYSRTRNVLVPSLRHEGYAVTFRSFAGGHDVPASISKAAVRWFLG